MTFPKSERVTLAGEAVDQGLLPCVATVNPTTRALAALTAQRDARRGFASLPAGGLFDEVAQAQAELFDASPKRSIAAPSPSHAATPDFDGNRDGLISERQSGREA